VGYIEHDIDIHNLAWIVYSYPIGDAVNIIVGDGA